MGLNWMSDAYGASQTWRNLPPVLNDEDVVNVFVEMVPSDTMLYRLHEEYGLVLEAPLPAAVKLPFAIGCVAQTLCGEKLGSLSNNSVGNLKPLQIFIFTDRPISTGGVFTLVKIAGGMPVYDDGLAADKLLGVLANDKDQATIDNIDDLATHKLQSVESYLRNYKGDSVSVGEPYGLLLARQVLEAAIADFRAS